MQRGDLPKGDPIELVRVSHVLDQQAQALRSYAARTDWEDLGFQTPKGREDELKGHLRTWRGRVRGDAADMEELSRALHQTAAAMLRADGRIP